MRGPEWEGDAHDEDSVDRACAIAAIVLTCALGAACVVAVRMLWRGVWPWA